jgi:diguanylate cyclase (GGDEF)-like protein
MAIRPDGRKRAEKPKRVKDMVGDHPDKKSLEVLASLPDGDRQKVVEIKKLKDMVTTLSMYEIYSSHVTDIKTLNAEIDIYEMMIKKNSDRLGLSCDDPSITYPIGEKISIEDALKDPWNMIEQTAVYQKELERLRKGLNDLKIKRDDLAEKVDKLMGTDGLTHLLNMISFEKRLKSEIARSGRNGECFVIVMADVNHFKQYNDTYGHPAGNEALRVVAKTLSRSLREGDISERGNSNYEDQYGRYGGDEFFYAMFGIPKDKVHEVVENKRKSIETAEITEKGKTFKPIQKEDTYKAITGRDSRHVAMSMGYFFFDPSEFGEKDKITGMYKYQLDHHEICEIIIGRADKALYAAKEESKKNAGRSFVMGFSPDMTEGTKN